MNVIDLRGCTPEPLLNYLKALGVFRLVAEQADPRATLSWTGGHARLHTALAPDGLTDFFLNRYRPTPVIAPWGGRSGFYPDPSESTARQALERICTTTDPRFEPYRSTIVGVRSILDRLGIRAKEDLKRGANYIRLLQSLRNELPEAEDADAVGQWLDAVYVLTTDDRKFPPLLGTGGNEGSGSYVSTFAQLVGTLLIGRERDDGVATALFGDPVGTLESVAVGHFHPGAIGGPNSSQGLDGGGGVNPWDYLLAIEGTLPFAGRAARRLGTDTAGRASYPFCVEAAAVGYASASDKEAGAGTRAEVWLPLWSMPATLPELMHLFGEGRAQFGRRQARNAVEFALALAMLGVGRGIEAFVRYAIVMRNGQSYFAAPLGRLAVTPRPAARLLDDPRLTDWIDSLRRACRDRDKTPARYLAALRQIDRAMFEFASRSEQGNDARNDAKYLLRILAALGRAERTMATGYRFCKEKGIRPLQGLSPQWLDQADDGSPEFCLAAALAGVGRTRGGEVGAIRTHLEEVEFHERFRGFDWSPGSSSAVWSRRPPADNLAAVFRRRQMEAFREGLVGVPLRSPCRARLDDVAAFLDAETDDDLLGDLLWGLVGIDWSRVEWSPRQTSPRSGRRPSAEFGIPRLLVGRLALVPERVRRSSPRPGQPEERLAWRLSKDRGADPNAVPDPDVFHQLSSGRPDAVERCVTRAARRLKSDGLLIIGYRNRHRAGKSVGVASAIRPGRLLAAMLFPLSGRDLERVANSVLYPPQRED